MLNNIPQNINMNNNVGNANNVNNNINDMNNNNNNMNNMNNNNNINNNIPNTNNNEKTQKNINNIIQEKDIFNKVTISNNNQNNVVKYENIQFGNNVLQKQIQEESNKFMENTNSKKIFVSYKKENKRFIFFSSSHEQLGSFDVNELIKYCADVYDVKNQFMNHVNIVSYEQAIPIIRTFVLKIDFNKKINYASPTLFTYEESPFMADIEMIMRLNYDLHKFETNELENVLKYVDDNIKNNIERIVKMLIYMFLNYTLQLLVIACENQIFEKSDDTERNEKIRIYKENIIKYSNQILYRITQFVQSQIGILMKKNNELKQLMDQNNQVKEKINTKMDKMSNNINNLFVKLEQIEKEKEMEKEIQNYSKIQDGGLVNHKTSTDQDVDEILSVNLTPISDYSGSDSDSDFSNNLESYSTSYSYSSKNSSKSSDKSSSKSHFNAIYDM